MLMEKGIKKNLSDGNEDAVSLKHLLVTIMGRKNNDRTSYTCFENNLTMIHVGKLVCNSGCLSQENFKPLFQS